MTLNKALIKLASDFIPASQNSVTGRSIKPPQVTLPNFYGNAEEFPEYWAIFETLVHKSTELDPMKKILLLEQSLKGNAQNSIKGIKLVLNPKTIAGIIQTLQQNYYDNQVIDRN